MTTEEVDPITKAKNQGINSFLDEHLEDEIKAYAGEHYENLTAQEREEISAFISVQIHKQHSY